MKILILKDALHITNCLDALNVEDKNVKDIKINRTVKKERVSNIGFTF